MKKMVENIRRAATWQERVKIAEDRLPGTKFDSVFEEAAFAKEMEKLGNTGIPREIYQSLGEALGRVITNGNPQALHDMAKALAIWKRHKPKPDYEFLALFNLTGMYPSGWGRRWWKGNHPQTGKPLFGLPAGTRETIAMRDLKKQIARTDPTFSEDKWKSRCKKIQRYAKEFSIPLDERPGKPPNTLRHNSQKKSP